MKKIIKLIILCIIFAQYSSIKAQGPNISVESIPGFPAQACYNQLYTSFCVFFHNNDSASYTGNIYIAFYTDTANSSIDTTSFGGPYQVSIPGNSFSSIPIDSFYFDPSSFKMGGNVVVVWPVSGGGTQITVTDTFHTYVEILGYAGISDIAQINIDNNIFPVPASNVLFLPQNIAENSIEHVRIIDMLGRTRILLKQYPKSISVAELENGFYFLEVKEKNGHIRISKFIVSR